MKHFFCRDMGDMENDTLSDAPDDCLASALLKSHEPKYLEAEESLQNLTYVTTMLRFNCVSYILTHLLHLKRERQEIVIGQLLKQSNKLGEAVTHNQIYEMVFIFMHIQYQLSFHFAC